MAECDDVEADARRAGEGARARAGAGAGASAVGTSSYRCGSSSIHGDGGVCCDEAVFFCVRWRLGGSTIYGLGLLLVVTFERMSARILS